MMLHTGSRLSPAIWDPCRISRILPAGAAAPLAALTETTNSQSQEDLQMYVMDLRSKAGHNLLKYEFIIAIQLLIASRA